MGQRYPAWIAGFRKQFPRFYFRSAHFGYVDTGFAHDLAYGMPIAGEVRATGALRPRIRPAALSVQQWRATLPERSRAIIKRAPESVGKPTTSQRRPKTSGEVAKECVTTPFPVTSAMSSSVALTPRCAHEAPHGGRAKKVRLIDDVPDILKSLG